MVSRILQIVLELHLKSWLKHSPACTQAFWFPNPKSSQIKHITGPGVVDIHVYELKITLFITFQIGSVLEENAKNREPVLGRFVHS